MREPSIVTPQRSTNPCRRGSLSGSAAVWLLFLPGLFLLGFALWQRTRPLGPTQLYDAPNAPEQTAKSGEVHGWEQRAVRQGVDLVVRLEKLHPLASRQAFDAAALAVRLRAGSASSSPEGALEPWRLTLSAIRNEGDGSGEEEDGDTSAADVGEIVIEDLSAVRVDGMEPLVHPDAVVATSGDPLATLMVFPAEPLRAGQACDLVFWGMAPGPEARVQVTGLGRETSLTATSRTGNRASQSIATLDAREDTTGGESRSEESR